MRWSGGGGTLALDPADKCEASKLKAAGKYGFCRLKAEAKSVKTGDPVDFSKCNEKYTFKWQLAETNGGGSCPSSGDEATIQAFITQHTDDVAAALAGGPLPTCQATPKGQRLQTGQTICYDGSGTVIACAGTGQDGELQKGLTQSFTDNGDGTITDNRTGLMWEKLSDDGSIHDWDDTYVWADAFSSKVAMLNSTTFAGYDDWRVPNVNELQSLANYGAVVPAVNTTFNTACAPGCGATCSCTQPEFYWSSTSYHDGPSYAWQVEFEGGSVRLSLKSDFEHVRAVRGGS